MLPDTESIAEFLGGFVAAEGCFTGDGRRRYRFSIGLGATDAGMCHTFQAVLGVGSIHESARRKSHYDDEVQYSVQSTRELVEVVIPFMDAHLPPSYKREQYLEWRASLVHHWTHRARGGPCSIDGCEYPANAGGRCGPHQSSVQRQCRRSGCETPPT